MAQATSRRRQDVLRAIVADFIASQEPVGSKVLLERHKLDVSSATIRNDMAVLESEGYIVQQHSSSGRIPTEKGYRQFVDSLDDIKPLSRAEHTAIQRFLEGGVDLEDVLRRSVQLLSQLTRQAAMVQLPNLNVSRVKHCEVVPLSNSRLLLVLITDTGRVDQRNVELEHAIDDADVARLREMLNSVLVGKTLSQASVSLTALADDAPSDLKDVVVRSARVLIETLVEQPSDRLILAGTGNLTRVSSELSASVPAVLDALEEQVVMLRLLHNITTDDEVKVIIGQENEDEELRGSSVVTAAYCSKDTALGAVGVVGPTYMDYTATIARVAAVARYVSRVLNPG